MFVEVSWHNTFSLIVQYISEKISQNIMPLQVLTIKLSNWDDCRINLNALGSPQIIVIVLG